MLAFPEMLKSLTPVKRMYLKKDPRSENTSLKRLDDLLAIILSIYLALKH